MSFRLCDENNDLDKVELAAATFPIKAIDLRKSFDILDIGDLNKLC